MEELTGTILCWNNAYGRTATRETVNEVVDDKTVKVEVSAAGDCFFLVLFLNLLIRAKKEELKARARWEQTNVKYIAVGRDPIEWKNDYWGSSVLKDLQECIDQDGSFNIAKWRTFCKILCYIPLITGTHVECIYPSMKAQFIMGAISLEMRKESLQRIGTPGSEIDQLEQEYVLYTLSRRYRCQFLLTGLAEVMYYDAPIIRDGFRSTLKKVPCLMIQYEEVGNGGHYSPRVSLSVTQDLELRSLLAEPFTRLGAFKKEYLGLEGAALYRKNLGDVFEYLQSKKN